MRISVLVYRFAIGEIETAVVVSAEQTQRVQNGHSLLRCLRRAITSWICETTEGREAWEHSEGDFNIGDLAGGYLNDKGPDESLHPFLALAGIMDFRIERPDVMEAEWTYDTVLADACTMSGRDHL